MARIVVAFFNGIRNGQGVPMFYEKFIQGLDACGNDVMIYTHQCFGVDFGTVDVNEAVKTEISQFKPELVFIFNNAFYDISDIVDCPIIVYEVDSPYYYSNKEILKQKKERYIYFVTSQESTKQLNSWGIEDIYIYEIPFFTEIKAQKMETKNNIAFIGSVFVRENESCINNFVMAEPTDEERAEYRRCIEYIKKFPDVEKQKMIQELNVLSGKVIDNVNIPGLRMLLSDEKRMNILSGVSDLGLMIWGTEEWGKKYYYNSPLNLCYNRKSVYSFEHNSQIYNSAKIGISISHLQAQSGFPWRIMDVMASSACLVTDYHSNLKKYFPEVDLPIYKDKEEARKLCKELLNDEKYRLEIVSACNEIIDKNYRFIHLVDRMERILNVKLRCKE